MTKNRKFDIVHINAITDGLVGMAACQTNRALVWHIREFMEEDLSLQFRNKREAMRLLNKSKVVIAISKAIKEKYEPLIHCPIKVVYNGIDVDRFYTKRKIFASDIVNICIVGRIDPGKGQEQLIEASILLFDRGYNFNVRIVGKNQYPTYKEQLVKKINESKYANRFTFVEHTMEIEREYEKSDILCVCSKKEGFGRVTVEGMVSGMLVIGANTGGTIELIEDGVTGYLYEEGNANSLASKIELSISDIAKSRNIAEKGREKSRNIFTVDNNANQIIEIYKHVINYEETCGTQTTR